jgi:RNA recognition motif-containing protein
MCDKITGHSKGYRQCIIISNSLIISFPATRFAYVEFFDKASVENALRLDDSTFLGRPIKVCKI